VAYLLRQPILLLSRSSKVRDVLVRAPLTRSVVQRFVAGTTAREALTTVRELREHGLQVTLDFLGEGVDDIAGAEETVRAYLDLIGLLEHDGLAEGSEVSVKPTAIGLSLPDGEAVALKNALRIAEAADAAMARMTIDMEDSPTVDATLRLLTAVRERHPDVGVAIQAMLFRTTTDLESLTHAGSRVRLVKGAYAEPASVAHQDPTEVDLAYVRGLKQLLAGDGYPMIGSHDPRLIAIAEELANQDDRSDSTYEFQMLYGIRPDEQRRLAAAGHTVRIYVPFGTDWYGYFTRRLAERPANLLFFLRSLISRN